MRFKPEDHADPEAEYAKYSPKSDFRLDNEHRVPVLLGEIISDLAEEDKWRMLLQAIGIVRLMSIYCDNPVIMAIYVNNEYLATRYIIYMVNKKVFIIIPSIYDLFLISYVLVRYRCHGNTSISQINVRAENFCYRSTTIATIYAAHPSSFAKMLRAYYRSSSPMAKVYQR